MTDDDVVERFEELAERYDALHRPGAWYRLKDDLGLGSGPFNDQLSVDEIKELIEELSIRISTERGPVDL